MPRKLELFHLNFYGFKPFRACVVEKYTAVINGVPRLVIIYDYRLRSVILTRFGENCTASLLYSAISGLVFLVFRAVRFYKIPLFLLSTILNVQHSLTLKLLSKYYKFERQN